MSSLPPRKYKTFLNDSDGLNSRDYLLLLSTSVFFLFIAIGLILVLLDKTIDEMYLSLLDMVSPVVMTIVGSVAGIDITDKITTSRRKRGSKKEEEQSPVKYISNNAVYDESNNYDPVFAKSNSYDEDSVFQNDSY